MPGSKYSCSTHITLTHCGPSDTIWRQRSGSTWAQVMACCLTAPSHYLNQCWLITSKVLWLSWEGNFTRDASIINHWNLFENYMSKISFKFPRGRWVKCIFRYVLRALPLKMHTVFFWGCYIESASDPVMASCHQAPSHYFIHCWPDLWWYIVNWMHGNKPGSISIFKHFF